MDFEQAITSQKHLWRFFLIGGESQGSFKEGIDGFFFMV